MDDTFVHGEDELDNFHHVHYLNTQHPSIQFTMEKESEGKIPFLDVIVKKKKEDPHESIQKEYPH